jgi:hypothetical protein
MKDTEHIIDAAFETCPLADLPPGFVRRTMNRIKSAPRFHLTFIDYVLPVFFSFFGAIILIILYWMLNRLNPSWGIDLGARFSLLAQYTSMVTIYQMALATAVCLVLLACAALAISFWLDKPIRLQRSIS